MTADRTKTIFGAVGIAVAVLIAFYIGTFVADIAADRDDNADRLDVVEQSVTERNDTIDALVQADEANRAAAERQGVDLPSAPAREIADTPSTQISSAVVSGPPGRDGRNGRPGRDGRNGIDGKNGAAGAVGAVGAVGVNGIDGINGVNGLDGLNGEPGAQGTPGAAGAQGPGGPAGPQGPAGAPGPAGPQGATGPPPAGITVPDGNGGTCVATDPDADGIYTCPPPVVDTSKGSERARLSATGT